jgi:hypothetical protein
MRYYALIMIEVFKTNVEQTSQAEWLIRLLHERFPHSDINFDLEDCDKILRVASHDAIFKDIALVLERQGFVCEELQD